MFLYLRRLFVRVRIQPGRRVRQAPAVRPAIDRLEECLAPAASPFAIGSPAGSAPLIRLFDSDTGAQVDQIRPFQPSYNGGVHVTQVDLDRDGAPEIIASAASGFPHAVVFDGHHMLVGSWMVNGTACGMEIREDTGPITGNTSRFVPHWMG